MAVLPMLKQELPAQAKSAAKGRQTNWSQVAAGVGLLAGGVLFLAGRRKEGLIAAATGTAIGVLDQQDVVKKWWSAMPGYIDNVQDALSHVQNSVQDFSNQRDRIHKIINK